MCFASNTGLARTTGLLHLITGVAIVYHFGVFYLKATDVLNWWGLRQSAIGIAPSSHVAETWLGGGLTSEQLQICPNWTNPDRFQHRTTQERLQLRRRLGIAPDIPLILYVGRLCAGKGVYTLISAVKLLNSSGVRTSRCACWRSRTVRTKRVSCGARLQNYQASCISWAQSTIQRTISRLLTLPLCRPSGLRRLD